MSFHESEPTYIEQLPPSLRPRLTDRGVAQDAEGLIRASTEEEIEEEIEGSIVLSIMRRIRQNDNPPSSPAGGRQTHSRGFGAFSLAKAQYDGTDGKGTPKPPISVPE